MSGSIVQIFYDGEEITNNCLTERCWFESQLNAIPGTCELVVKDLDNTLSFITGHPIEFLVDNILVWGGYLMQIGRGHAFPADDTSDLASYDSRLWTLRGADYNVLFDKRVVRNTSNYLTQIFYPGATMDGTLLKDLITNYSDLDTGEFNLSTIDDVDPVNQWDTTKKYAIAQGTYLRDTFNDLAKFRGQIYYIDGSKNVHFHSLEAGEASWGFSDQPNYAPVIDSGPGYQGCTYGFREVEATEDGSFIVNDALIWGGSAWTSDGGSVVFARYQDAVADLTSTASTYIQHGDVDSNSSIDLHGRWQMPESHVGEEGFGLLGGVKARADSIVNGPPGTDAYGQTKGLRYSQWTFSFTWFANRVPTIDGQPQHLIPGNLVTIEMNVFDVTKVLPLRTLRTTFPSGAEDGTTYVQFQGEFGIQNSDPISLWTFLLNAEKNVAAVPIATSGDGSTSTMYGASGQFTPVPEPDGIVSVFALPHNFGYISGTLRVSLNGIEQRPNTDFTETDPEAGTFTMTSIPHDTDYLFVKCRTLAG